ncbi:hypothetical protein F6B43_00655 [Microbacterium rhizomatis]|uniref:Uncharacterized protein n=1 Tax=Microbacterium rhizomatis TaxID=1631477 RepID=A0A5J5J671_9MICO|nr:hypothetical protein F6B43_00655 [Microbacterium rhizomatis]
MTERTQKRRWSALPVAARIAVLYVGARIVTTGFLLLAAALSGVGSRFGPDARIGDLMVGWDAQWYWFTAINGYPATLPLTATGAVAENQWAFMPVYAYLSSALGAVFGSWGAAAVVISLVAGYLACLVLYRMLRPAAAGESGSSRAAVDEQTAMWAVAFFASAPLAAMFQVGYAESLFLLWLFLALLLVQRRRYGWLYLLIPLMGFTRPGVLAFALFLGLFGISRWIRRRTEPLGVRETVHIVALSALAVVVGFAWQVIAGIVTGDSGAYLATELAWRRNWLAGGDSGFVPFDGFFRGAAFWFGSWGLGEVTGYVVLAVAVMAVAALLLFEPHVRRLGVELRLWIASYLGYLLVVFFPQSSLFRLLLPISPLWGAAAMPRSRVWRVGVLAACLLGQWWWIYNMYALGNTYWQIP